MAWLGWEFFVDWMVKTVSLKYEGLIEEQ